MQDDDLKQETSVETPPDTNAPQKPVIGAPPSKKKKTLIISIICAAILLIGGGVFAWMQLSKDEPTSHPNNTVSADFKIAPRFNQVHDYSQFNEAEWYAVDGGVIRLAEAAAPVYYMQREGVPLGVPTSLVVHNDKLWIGAQNGVATLKSDESGFEAAQVPANLSNGVLYQDSYSDKLYLSSFDGLYAYNDEAGNWVSVSNGPENLYSFAIGKNFLVSTTNGQGMPVWVYNKSTSKWAMQKPSGIDDNAVQTTFAIGEDLFVMGRSTGYQSCEQSGKITATSVYHLDQSGVWQPLTSFNADKTRPELNLAKHVKDPSTVFYTSTCGQNEVSKKYTVTYKDNTLVLEEINDTSNWQTGFMGDDGEQNTLVTELSTATGLNPFIRVLAADKAGNLIFSYSTKADRSSTPTPEGIAVAKVTDFTKATQIKLTGDEKYDVQNPVLCDGTLTYLFVGTYDREQTEGFANGKWAKTQLLYVNGTVTEPFVDLANNVGEPTFACGNGKVSWLGKDAVQQLDIASKKITSVGSGLPASNAQQTQSVYPLPTGDMWLLLSTDPSKEKKTAHLYHFTSASLDLKKIGTYTAVALLGGSATHAWLAEGYNTNSDAFNGLAIYDKAGVKTNKAVEFLRLGLTTDTTAFIAQKDGTPSSIFVPFKMVKYTLGGADADVPPATVPARELRLSTAPNEAAPYTNNGGVLDPSKGRMWFSDDQLGSFSVDL